MEVHQLKISEESVRQIMIAEGMWKPKRAKQPAVHQMRERRACFGELVQIDGSDHAWFEERGPKCTLLVFIDDATGQLVELWFVPDETFFAYCEATRHHILSVMANRWPSTATNMASFRVNQPRPLGTTSGLTQFGRAMQELDIQIICANTPQAKGRIERANQTLQDRLVKELRLRGISDMEAGNAYLARVPGRFQPPFCRCCPAAATMPTALCSRLKTWTIILTHQEDRHPLQKPDRPIQACHLPNPVRPPRLCPAQCQVTVCENAKGEVTILYKNKPLSYTIFHKPTRQAEVVDTKTLDHQLKPPKSPAPDHPWRTLWPPPQRQTYPRDPSQWLRLKSIGG